MFGGDRVDKLLENKIMHDIAEHMKSVMVSRKITFRHDADDANIILAYMNVLGKRIYPKPRKVIFSNELKNKIKEASFIQNDEDTTRNQSQQTINLITHFKTLFENGQDVNNHLSTQIFSSKRQDILFNTWNIKHIHLNEIEAGSKNAMKKNRADFLLFCIVENEFVYFLDVRYHPNSDEFSSYSFLQIAFNNGWMEKLGFSEIGAEYIPYSMEPKVTDDKTLYNLYNSNINLAFDFQGHGFIGIATGVTGSGDKIENVHVLNQFRKQIRKIPFTLADYDGFIPSSQENASGLVKFRCNDQVYKCNFTIE